MGQKISTGENMIPNIIKIFLKEGRWIQDGQIKIIFFILIDNLFSKPGSEQPGVEEAHSASVGQTEDLSFFIQKLFLSFGQAVSIFSPFT